MSSTAFDTTHCSTASDEKIQVSYASPIGALTFILTNMIQVRISSPIGYLPVGYLHFHLHLTYTYTYVYVTDLH